MSKPKPQLPLGNSSTLRGISENLSFHASPEEFISSRILQIAKANPNLVDSRTAVRARILNRNVAVVSSHAQIRHVLCEGHGVALKGDVLDTTEAAAGYQTAYTASLAYNELMAPFFPCPNLLLTDGKAHTAMRESWEQRLMPVTEAVKALGRSITRRHFQSLQSGTEIDLYDSLKSLAWKLLLGTFLDLKPQDSAFALIERLQEDLLRGQFSLMPVSINAGFWQSPRKKAVDAKKQLQKLILERLESIPELCIFQKKNETGLEEVANHVLLFTSSLAVKALASLLTAFLLNLYVFDGDAAILAQSLRNMPSTGERATMLSSMLLETERLSPPIVGVMRRAIEENIIPSSGEEADVLIPKGWDVWLYFAGGARDPAAFGNLSNQFVPKRHLDGETQKAFTFGDGPKTCLGQDLVRSMALTVAETCLDIGLDIAGRIDAKGVREWLGWDEQGLNPEAWAADMKQLPTQHPARPIPVKIEHPRA